jgi:hypothetical protein
MEFGVRILFLSRKVARMWSVKWRLIIVKKWLTCLALKLFENDRSNDKSSVQWHDSE